MGVERRDDPLHAPTAGKPRRCFSGSEEHQGVKLFLDGVEAVFEAGLDKEHAASLNRPLLVTGAKLSGPAEHAVNLVLRMRALLVRRSPRQDIEAHAERW